MNVLVTGAYGQVGTAIIDHLDDAEGYDFTYFNRSDRPADHPYGGYDTVEADVADYDAIRTAVDEQDAIVHLAAAPKPDDPWKLVLESNVIGTYNVLEAAADAGVEQVLFGSTHHVMGGYEDEHAPALYDPDYPLTLDPDDPVRPDSYYAVSKLFGEHLGHYYVEYEEGLERFYSLRITNVGPEQWDDPWGWAERAVASGEIERGSSAYDRRVDRHMNHWCSRRDLAQIVDLCLQDKSVTHDAFNVVSGNTGGWWNTEHAEAVLGYEPADDAREWTENPHV
jgi:nucleoside-diphosphate-sugar epimerase